MSILALETHQDFNQECFVKFGLYKILILLILMAKFGKFSVAAEIINTKQMYVNQSGSALSRLWQAPLGAGMRI